MKHRNSLPVLCSLSVLLLVSAAQSQPPEGRGGPPRYQLGQIFPPPLQAELKLTPDQEKELKAIQSELKARLDKLLTEEQKKTAENFRPRRPGGPEGAGDKDAQPPRRSGDNPPAKGGKRPDDKELNQPVTMPEAGIQWFATLESGLKEANRTNRPILLVAGTPHCAGVSGIW